MPQKRDRVTTLNDFYLENTIIKASGVKLILRQGNKVVVLHACDEIVYDFASIASLLFAGRKKQLENLRVVYQGALE